jgi:hypothetical protein
MALILEARFLVPLAFERKGIGLIAISYNNLVGIGLELHFFTVRICGYYM